MGFALLITGLAGMATTIGAGAAFFASWQNTRLLPRALAFSAGVMLCVSFAELLPTALTELQAGPDAVTGWQALALAGGAFLTGAVLVALIELLIPAGLPRQNPVLKAGLLTAAALALHNLPEGIAVFISNWNVTGEAGNTAGLALALAVGFHNIPEGVAVAVPVYYATGSRGQAFGLATLSGLTEPLGALLAFWLLAPVLTPLVLGLTFAAVAGMMVYISLETLLPAALAGGGRLDPIVSLMAGGIVMGLSLLPLGG